MEACSVIVSKQEALDSARESLRVYADDMFCTALCAFTGIVCKPLSEWEALLTDTKPDVSVALSRTHSHAVVVDTSVLDAWLFADERVTAQAIRQVEQRWIDPFIEQLRSGQIGQWILLTEDGHQAICDQQTLRSSAREYATDRVPWWRRLLASFNQ